MTSKHQADIARAASAELHSPILILAIGSAIGLTAFITWLLWAGFAA